MDAAVLSHMATGLAYMGQCLIDRADIVELSLVSRDGPQEPLTEQFLRLATR